MTPPRLVEHFFRHEYGRLVALLSCREGVQHIEAVEDAVQSALMKVLETWTTGGLPDNPSAWLYRVAHNKLIGELRMESGRRRILEENTREDRLNGIGIGGASTNLDAEPKIFLAGEMRDEVLPWEVRRRKSESASLLRSRSRFSSSSLSSITSYRRTLTLYDSRRSFEVDPVERNISLLLPPVPHESHSGMYSGPLECSFGPSGWTIGRSRWTMRPAGS